MHNNEHILKSDLLFSCLVFLRTSPSSYDVPFGSCRREAEQNPGGIKHFLTLSYIVLQLQWKEDGEANVDNDSAGWHIKFLLCSHLHII